MNWRKTLMIGSGISAVLLLGAGFAMNADFAGADGLHYASAAQPRPEDGRPQRIVSLNLCTDQLLISLANREDIAGVTQFAADPAMSAAADRAMGLPAAAHKGETLLALQPDMLIGSPASGSPLAAILGDRAGRMVDVPFVRSYSDITSNLRVVGQEIGHPARAEAVIARMEKQLGAIQKNGKNRIAVYYQRRGFMTGSGTLVDDMMHRVGLKNLATVLGKSQLSQISLEEMVAANPDFLIVEAQADQARDQGRDMLNHPALAHIPRLTISEALTVCGGPEYPRAIQTLTAQIAAHDRISGDMRQP